MQFPVEYDPINEVDGIEEWERVNKFGVYLFKWNEKHRLAFQVRKAAEVYEDEVTMLLHSERYFLVSEGNRQRLFGEQGARGGGTNMMKCYRCMDQFTGNNALTKHLEEASCLTKEIKQRTRLPKGVEESHMYFKNFAHLHDHPCVVFADFETYKRDTSKRRGEKLSLIHI